MEKHARPAWRVLATMIAGLLTAMALAGAIAVSRMGREVELSYRVYKLIDEPHPPLTYELQMDDQQKEFKLTSVSKKPVFESRAGSRRVPWSSGVTWIMWALFAFCACAFIYFVVLVAAFARFLWKKGVEKTPPPHLQRALKVQSYIFSGLVGGFFFCAGSLAHTQAIDVRFASDMTPEVAGARDSLAMTRENVEELLETLGIEYQLAPTREPTSAAPEVPSPGSPSFRWPLLDDIQRLRMKAEPLDSVRPKCPSWIASMLIPFASVLLGGLLSVLITHVAIRRTRWYRALDSTPGDT